MGVTKNINKANFFKIKQNQALSNKKTHSLNSD